ncbi:MAG: hypothetical protein OEY28_07740 [Nitrospira sp.]|nr:hypothetical protein [Nitrospira sp.]
MPDETEQAYIKQKAAEGALAELIEAEARAFARRAALSCLVLCMVGVMAFGLCLVSGFDLSFGDGNVAMRNDGSRVSATSSVVDVTLLVAGIAAAAFAANLIVGSGTLPSLRRMRQSSSSVVILTVIGSAAGLVALVVAG